MRRRLEQVFFQDRELDGADIKNAFVEFYHIKIFPQAFLAGCAQIQEIQISKVVFQIVGRGFHNVLENFLDSERLCDAKGAKKFCGFTQIPAVVMNADIKK